MRRVCVMTGTRADYGHLRWILAGLRDHPGIELQLVVAAAHLSPAFGFTVREIEADGHPIHARVEMLQDDDSGLGVATSTGLGTMRFAEAFAGLEPDLLVILGDRFEALAAAQAALFLRIPVAHLHGGEVSFGALDESLRHAITKLSHLHFVAAEPYRRRVIQLGEDPARVHLVGTPGLDALEQEPPMTRQEIEASLGWSLEGPLAVVTYHPATSHAAPGAGVHALVQALEERPDLRVLVTGVNADEGRSEVSAALDGMLQRQAHRMLGVRSLGQRRYLSTLRLASVVVGNSSSGLVEAPAIGVPTVNIGPRQDGRLRAASVLDTPAEPAAIGAALDRALLPQTARLAREQEPPYGRPGASARVVEVLATASLEGILVKRFCDI